MRLAVALLFAASALSADERWIEYRSGPFEVLTNAGERAGRETLARLEQFRYALGQIAGKPDPQATWPVRVLVLKSAQQQAYSSAVPLGLARDAFTGSVKIGRASC